MHCQITNNEGYGTDKRDRDRYRVWEKYEWYGTDMSVLDEYEGYWTDKNGMGRIWIDMREIGQI